MVRGGGGGGGRGGVGGGRRKYYSVMEMMFDITERLEEEGGRGNAMISDRGGGGVI